MTLKMTMFLMKGDAVLGTCQPYTDGYRFIPNLSGRRPSRRSYPTANACVPAWALKLSDRFITRDEFHQERQARMLCRSAARC